MCQYIWGFGKLHKRYWNFRALCNDIKKFVFLFGSHCWYIEPRNREKSLTLIWQRFSCLLDEWIAKISKKKISRWVFEIIHIIHFEIWDLRSRYLKIFLGYGINYLSIWTLMRHPWFPTKGLKTNICLFSASWKQSHGLKTDKCWFWGLSKGKSRVTHKMSNA